MSREVYLEIDSINGAVDALFKVLREDRILPQKDSDSKYLICAVSSDPENPYYLLDLTSLILGGLPQGYMERILDRAESIGLERSLQVVVHPRTAYGYIIPFHILTRPMRDRFRRNADYPQTLGFQSAASSY